MATSTASETTARPTQPRASDDVSAAPSRWARAHGSRWLGVAAAVVAIAAGGLYARARIIAAKDGMENVASGNGRIEAVEIDVAAKSGGRLESVLVEEGDFVEAGQVLARVDTSTLTAQRRQAEAQLQRATVAVDMAKSLVVEREAERRQAIAVVAQRQAQLDAASARLARTEQLTGSGALPPQTLDDDRAAALAQKAGRAAAEAQVASADAAIAAAKIQVLDAQSAVEAAKASIEVIGTEIADGELKAPRSGRVQLRVAQPGEVLAPGARVVELVDITDVSMTFFLPTEQAGRTAIGSEVRLVLDAARGWVLPAEVTFVAPEAQFTPKTVETASERQKLMFRVKARIAPSLLERHAAQVKVGLPGMAYVRLDASKDWPVALSSVVRE